MLAPIAHEQAVPLLAQLPAALSDAVLEVLDDAVGDEEFGVLGPAVEALRLAGGLLAERLAVDRGGVLLRRAVADVAVQHDQGGLIVVLAEALEGALEQPEVVRVADSQNLPSVAHEPGGDVVVVGDLGRAVDRDVVVVVEPAQVVEPLMAGERCRFVRDALHQVAVAAEDVDVVVEELEAGPVEVRRLPLAGDRHPDRCRDALPEWASGRLHARRPAVLGMACRLRVELAERLDVVEGHRLSPEDLVVGIDGLHPGQIEQGVEEHRRVAGREHEAVAVGPDRVLGIEAQEALPEGVGGGREGHRSPGVAGVRLLDRVDAQRPDRVDAEGLDVGPGGDRLFHLHRS